MEYSIDEWVSAAPKDSLEFRKAVHIILTAISSSDYLKPRMIMKGGILLGIRYNSSRFTTDIDFSSAEKLIDIDQKTFISELNDSLSVASSELTYGIVCKIQSVKIQPKNGGTFPSFNLKIGYGASSNKALMSRLSQGNSPFVIKIDYSLNEMTYNTDQINLEDNNSISAYSFTDLVAEKIRSIIQQPYRDRNRRQDVYDLHHLLTTCNNISEEEKMLVLTSLLKKCEGRVPLEDVHIKTLEREDIMRMSEKDYSLLKSEVKNELPNFSDAYSLLVAFYKSLPWEFK